MKLLLSGWPSTERGKAIGFFAQAALELVHEKSWESYKLQTLSPIWRLREARKVSQSVIRGILPAKALEPIVDEANGSLCSDPVCRKIMSSRDIEVSDVLVSRDDKAHDVLTHCSFLIQICRDRYRKTAEDLLIEECFGQGRRSEIYAILRSYFSQVVLDGQSRFSIEKAVRGDFFATIPGRFDRNLLRRFFAKFPDESQKYKVYGHAEKALVDAMGRLFPVKPITGRSIPRKLTKLAPKSSAEIYFVIETEARDHYSSVSRTGKLLGIGEAVLMLFPGDDIGKLPQHLYAAREGTSDYTKAPTKPNFSKRVLSHSTKSALRHMDRVRDLIIRSQSKSSDNLVGSDFLRATMTASLADNATAPEVKLLTLWAAFEALLPIVPDGATNRISHFLEYIVPGVSLSYARDCFVEFTRDAERLHHRDFKRYLDSIPGDLGAVDKVAAVVVGGDDEQKGNLCKIFENNPLALFRLMTLQQKFSHAQSFEKSINDHSERVKWQVQRIYRERNTVMHNGESSPFVEQLLSNTYYYYLLIFTNIETISKSYGGLSIPQSLSAIRKLSQSDESKLKRAKAASQKNPLESQIILLDLISGHFRSDE